MQLEDNGVIVTGAGHGIGRALAARFRGHAAETSLKLFQDKFQAMAADLEEAARRAEHAALGPPPEDRRRRH